MNSPLAADLVLTNGKIATLDEAGFAKAAVRPRDGMANLATQGLASLHGLLPRGGV